MEHKTVISDLELLETTGKNFRFKSKKVHLTYKTHMLLGDIIDKFSKVLPNKIKNWSFCHESGKTDYDHTHFAVEFKETVETTNPRFFDVNGIHPNIGKVKSILHWDNIIMYHRKEGKWETNLMETSKPKGRKGKNNIETATVESVLQYNSAAEAVRGVNDVKLIGGVELAFRYKVTDFGPEPTNIWFRAWQRELREEILGTIPHKRRIIWYYDELGASGKSVMAEHAFIYWKDAVVLTSINERDAATVFQSHLNKGLKINIVIIDLSRSDYNILRDPETYKALEKFKNGVFTVTKYQSVTINTGINHVVVFANQKPCQKLPVKKPVFNDNEEKIGITFEEIPVMSKDKWDIRYLEPITTDDLKTDYVVSKREYTEDVVDKIPEGYVMPGLASLALKNKKH